jgi:uncharacterized protein YegP (UPF0339 family)
MALKRPEITVQEARYGGEFYWHLQSVNGEILAVGEMHPSRDAAEQAARTARKTMRFAKILSE